MFETIAHAVADSAKLTTLGDGILPRMLSGRVRVGRVDGGNRGER